MNKNPFRPKQYAKMNVYRTGPAELSSSMEKPNVPEGIMTKCPQCGKATYTKILVKEHNVCPSCGYHNKINAYERLNSLVDEDSFQEMDRFIQTTDPLDFPGYNEKIRSLQEKTRLSDGVLTGIGKIEGNDTAIGIMDPTFLMGSMGTVVGEKITRLFEEAIERRIPVILFTASGGARMQEGIFSLMQMAKVSGAVARHSDMGLLYITVLTNPTTGGVTASFAMLGDIIISEPGALIGFAGPRVIAQTIGQTLPEDFQKAEFLLDHGFIDCIVHRNKLRSFLGNMLRLHSTTSKSS